MKNSNEWANFWRLEVGVNVIPANTKNKKPLVTWKEFQAAPISLELHNEWINKGLFKDGMAIICGEVFHNEEHRGKWLNAIDCDNLDGTNAMCSTSVDITASKTLVEQHDNKQKCHILSYTDKPLKNRAINPKNKELIEVKSMGKNILYCSGGVHKDGSMIDIVGTDKVGYIPNSQYIEESLDKILGKTSSLSSLDDIPLEEMGPGTNRGGSLIRELQRYFAHVPQTSITLEDYKMKALFFNSKFPEGKSESDVIAIAMSQYKIRMNDEPTYFELKDAEKEAEFVIPVIIDTVTGESYQKNLFRCTHHNATYDKIGIVECRKDHPQNVYNIKRNGELRSKIGEKIKLNQINARYVHRTMESNVIVVGISNHIPYELQRTYECVAGCNVKPVTYVADEYRELGAPKIPGSCSCDNDFNILIHDKDVSVDADVQFIRIQQATSEDSNTPIDFEAILYSPNICIVQPGSEYKMTYIVRSVIDEKKVMKFSLEVIDMQILESEIIPVPTLELEAKFQNIGIEKIVESIAPKILFRYNEKFAILSSILSGKRNESGRRELHTLLIGNAGTGKSEMLNSAISLSRTGHSISSPSASKAGLLLGQQDNGSGKKELTIGPIVRANDSFITMDEFEKMSQIDSEILHTPLTDGIARYDKNGFNTPYPCRVRLIAACNPVKSIWNPSKSLQDNTNLAPTMLDRFGLIFVLTNNTLEENEAMLDSEGLINAPNGLADYIKDNNMLTKQEMRIWIADAQRYDPVMSPEGTQVFKEQYRAMQEWQRDNGDEKESPLTNRARNDVVMIAYSVARMHRTDTITGEHVKIALDIFTKSLKSCGFATSKEKEAKEVKTMRLEDIS